MKRVVVLGAGFSKPAGIPTQVELLRSVHQIVENAPWSLSRHLIKLLDALPGSLDKMEIEDLFTVVDEAISTGRFLLGLTPGEVVEAQETLLASVVSQLTPQSKQLTRNLRTQYKRFLLALLHENQFEDQSNVVVSLNWDALPETMLMEVMSESGLGDHGFLDFECDLRTMQSEEYGGAKVGTTLQWKALPFLKLHGSVSWLKCPSCESVFTGLTPESLSFAPVSLGPCPDCARGYPDSSAVPILRSNLITPTYLKRVTDTHSARIWHIAAQQIRNADRIIFIGYSMPDSDYHLRSLLARSVRQSCSIEVVLRDSGTAKDAGKRFTSFFSRRSLLVTHVGAIEFMRRYRRSWSVPYLMSRLKSQ